MKAPIKHLSSRSILAMVFVVIIGLVITVVCLILRHSVPIVQQPLVGVQSAKAPPSSPEPTSLTNSQNRLAATASVLQNWLGFQKRPLAVAYESAKTQWTLADGKDTNVIRQLAHNPLEYDRMVEENPRILKRQLVYLKETAAAVFEQAKLTSTPVNRLTLPGLDGQELQFEIVKSEGNGSSRQGMFSGHLADNNDSTVTMAFQDGREAFTVLSPKDNIFVVGEPREDGQVIVKAIDPNTYGVGPAGAGEDFIITTNK